MTSSLLRSAKNGLIDLKRMPVLTFALALSVALATFLALLSPLLDQAVDVGSEEIVAGSEVIVSLSPALEPEAEALAIEELSGILGVGAVRHATSEDIASTRGGFELGTDTRDIWTLVLDGRAPQESIASASREISGVETAEAGVGVSLGLSVQLLRIVVPWLAVASAAAGMILVLNVVFASSRSRREEAQIMRLVGASWPAIWANLGAVVLVPVVGSMLLTTGIVSLAASRLLNLLSPQTNPPASGLAVLGFGLRLTAIAVVVSIAVALLGLSGTRR